MHIRIRLIFELVPDLWSDLNPLSLFENNGASFKAHNPFALKYIKELTRLPVIMHDFTCSSRDALLYNTHVITLEQVPAVTNLAPDIMFSIINGNQHGNPRIARM